MRVFLAAASAASLLSVPAAASATIINIDAAVSGCDFSHCAGNHVPPGTVINTVLTPTQITLGAGSYTVTNANGLPGANPAFAAWNYNKIGANWLWSFMAINDSNLTVLLDSLPDSGIAVVGTQAAAAAQPAAVNYVGHFTLAQTATIDFVTEDWLPSDNLGGVSLDVQLDGRAAPGVPEPASWALMISGFAIVGSALRRRRKVVAA